MALRRALQSVAETVQDLELAAEQKYWEGLELMVAGRAGAGLYLMGYLAEMWLKVSWFQLGGSAPADLVRPLLGPARAMGRRLFPAVSYEAYHSLRFWCYLLLSRHRRRGRRLNPRLKKQFTRHVRTLYSIWWIEMRYRPDRAGIREAQGVYEAVTWLRTHLADLRR